VRNKIALGVCTMWALCSAPLLQLAIHGANLTSTIPNVADGLWHFVCTSWQPSQSTARVSVDARASCGSSDSGPVQADQDAATLRYALACVVRVGCPDLEQMPMACHIRTVVVCGAAPSHPLGRVWLVTTSLVRYPTTVATPIARGGCWLIGQRPATGDVSCSRLNPAYSYEGYMREVTMWTTLLSVAKVGVHPRHTLTGRLLF
jgi:hypothetical protein